jgi:hypothetical protein
MTLPEHCFPYATISYYSLPDDLIHTHTRTHTRIHLSKIANLGTNSEKFIMSKIKAKLSEARDFLSAFQEDEAQEDDESQEVIIIENKSLEWNQKFLDREPKLPVHIRLEDGKIEVYEVPSQPHGMVGLNIAHFIMTLNPKLTGISKPVIIVGPASMNTADAAIIPRGLPRPPPALSCDRTGAAYPTWL